MVLLSLLYTQLIFKDYELKCFVLFNIRKFIQYFFIENLILFIVVYSYNTKILLLKI